MSRVLRSALRPTIVLMLAAAMLGCGVDPRTGEAGPPSADPPPGTAAPGSPGGAAPVEKR